MSRSRWMGSSGSPSLSGNTCALLGDSITAENYGESTVNYARTKGARWFALLNFLLGQRLMVLNNAAVGGERTDQMLGRLDSGNLGVGFGSQGAPGILGLPKLPAWVFVMGGTNDINQGRSFETITGNLQQIYTRLLNRGCRVVAFTITPAGGYSTAYGALLMRINDWIRAVASSTSGMVLVDAWAAMIDPNSATLGGPTAYYRDGNLHPNNVGGMAIARAAFRVLDPLIPKLEFLASSNYETQAFDSSCSQLLDNPLMLSTAAATGTGITGTGPAGATYGVTAGGSLTVSMVARADGLGNDVKFVGAFSAAGQTHQMTLPSVHARAVEGGVYYAACTARVTGPSGAALAATDNLRTVSLMCQVNVNGTNYQESDLAQTATDAAFVGSYEGVLRTPDFVMAPGTVSVFRPYILNWSHGAGNYEASFGRFTLRRVS